MTRSSGTQPRRLDRGQTPQGTSRSLRESPFSSIQKGLVPTIFAEEHFSSVSDALGACARALSNERALRTVVLISMSDDFEIVLGRKLTDAFRVQLPEATPILRQTNAHLAEGGGALLSRATRFTITGDGTHSNVVSRESFGLHWDCRLFYEPDPAKRGRTAFTLDEYAARPHVVMHYSGDFGVAEGCLRPPGHRRQIDAMTSHFTEVPQYRLGNTASHSCPYIRRRSFMSAFLPSASARFRSVRRGIRWNSPSETNFSRRNSFAGRRMC